MIISKGELDSADLGERLRMARETANLTQQSAADEAGIGRTTLVAIERGHRRVRTDELQSLALAYRVSINALLRREAVHVDLVPRFRALPQAGEAGIASAVQTLNDLVRAEVELENLLGVQRSRNYPAERKLRHGDVRAQAEQDAQTLRHWIGAGEGPVQNLVALMELQLGIRVYSRALDHKVSGLFAYDESVGACILLNAEHRRDRRNQTAGHELGHFMATRGFPEIYQDAKKENTREERYARSFGRAFLTPARPVIEKFGEVTAGSSHLTRRHLILLAHYFGVSRQAIALRLEELDLTRTGTWDWFSDNGGISDEQARQVLGETAEAASTERRSYSSRLFLLAIEAWKRDIVSEGQMAEMLKLGRLELRELLDEAEAEEEEVNDLFKLSH